MSYLDRILEVKRAEVDAAKALLPLAELEVRAKDAPPVRRFKSALEAADGIALIAEVKAASPSQGSIRPDLDPVAVAKAYEQAGAHALSVLTDREFFKGSPENLVAARGATSLPALRKDFIVDAYQIPESRAMGADAILLIVAALSDAEIAEFLGVAATLGMDALVEVHDEAEMERALTLRCDLIGVNNRNLSTFETSLEVSEVLLPRIVSTALGVSESSLSCHADVARVQAAGARAVLIGTTFCSAPDIGAKVREVMGWT